MKFFRKFQADREFLGRVAIKLELQVWEKDRVIFQEGDYGNSFYMILDGEVAIVKTKIYKRSLLKENVTLVKLYRGQAFGETALDGNGLRSAGAIATQDSKLLLLHEKDYRYIMKRYRVSSI